MLASSQNDMRIIIMLTRDIREDPEESYYIKYREEKYDIDIFLNYFKIKNDIYLFK